MNSRSCNNNHNCNIQLWPIKNLHEKLVTMIIDVPVSLYLKVQTPEACHL